MITKLTDCCNCSDPSRKSISLDVTIPTNLPPNLPFSVTGKPQNPCSSFNRKTSDTYN